MEFVMPRSAQPGQRALARRDHHSADRLQLATPTIRGDKYMLNLDLHHFAPEEVQVQMGEDRMLKVTGRKEVKSEDGSHYEFREYSHHFTIPESVQQEQMSVKLDKNGLLSIRGPIKVPEKAEEKGVKTIPIEFVNNKQ